MTVIKKFCDRCGEEVDWLYNVPQFSIQRKRLDIRDGCDSDGQLCEDCMWKLIQVIRAFPKGKEMEYLKTEQDILKMLEIMDGGKKSIHHINPITAETIECDSDSLFDTDNLICVSDIGIPIDKEEPDSDNESVSEGGRRRKMSTDRSAIVTKISVMIQEFLEETLLISSMSDLFKIPEAPIPDPVTAIRNVIYSVVTDMRTHAKTRKCYYNEGNLHFRYPKIIAWDNHKNLTATAVSLIFYDEGELYTMEYAEQILQYVFDTLCVFVTDTSVTDIDWRDDLKWHRFREKIEDILEDVCIEAQKEEIGHDI